MPSKRRRIGERTVVPPGGAALDKLCPDLSNWPTLWEIEHNDVAIGQRIVDVIRPFLLDMLQHGLAHKTLARHRDHLQMLGGEIIRLRHVHPDLDRQSVRDLVFNLVDDDGGPLVWPRITESAQDAFDATCRKLYRFLLQQKSAASRK